VDQIAIVGIGCRYAGGVTDAESLWQFLLDKRDGVVEVPADRWSLAKFYDADPDAPGRMYTRKGGFLTDSLWEFDADFFGVSAREASIMDPQQRLLLEVGWEALEDAGLAGRAMGGSVGVFVGAFTTDNALARMSPISRTAINGHTAMSSSQTLLSNRLSYAFDFRGPSMTIDTACSSSLVAFHQATRAMEAGECELALVGGVNVMFKPETFISMCKGRFLAFDGRSKSFDAAADGYGRGEGAGIVVLKRLDAALRDRDRIYAVVRGSGVNQDGRTSAIPVPNPVAQEELALRVCRDAGVSPHEIVFVEAHGTGTAVGDPIEMSALGKVYGAVAGRREKLYVGSLKSSIGHTEAASGIAGLIKAALTVHHRMIAPQGWLDTLNPAIPFDQLNLEVPTTAVPVPDCYGTALAAVNSFGYGGTNAHVILEQPPVNDQSAHDWSAPAYPVMPISGRSVEAVRVLAGDYADLLEKTNKPSDVVAAAWTRRAHHPFRAAFPCTDIHNLVTELRAFAGDAGRSARRTVGGSVAEPVFVFSGMGPQWWAMARELLSAGGVFARTAKEVDAEFQAIAGWSILTELLCDEGDSRMARTEIAQPANFLVQVCLAAELAERGVQPAAIVGHSVGEVSAAYLSGALSLSDALLVSFHRSRLQATTAGAGTMLAVGVSEAEAREAISADEGISIAAVNGPSSVTLAGAGDVISRLHQTFTDRGCFARLLQVEVPYHSHLMDPILADTRSALHSIRPRTPKIPLYSTVHAARVTGAQWDAEYWCDNIRQPVRFADTIDLLIAAGHRVFVEVGPHPVLSGYIREILIRAGETGTSIATLCRGDGDQERLRQAIGELYIAGVLDDTHGAGPDADVSPHVQLPRYPWQKTQQWSEPDVLVRDRIGATDTFPMLGEPTDAGAPEWQAHLGAEALSWLPDHVVNDKVVLPGAAYLDAALSAAATRSTNEDLALEDVKFVAPLVIEEHDVPVVRFSMEESTKRFTIHARHGDDSGWTLHATGRLVEGRITPRTIDLPAVDGTAVNGDELYSALAARGLRYGPAFRRIIDAAVGADSVLARIDTRVGASGHVAHPTIVDAALQCMAALGGSDRQSGAVVPVSVQSVRRFSSISTDEAYVLVTRVGTSAQRADIDIVDPSGRQLISLSGVEFRPVSRPRALEAYMEQVFYEPQWELWAGDRTPLVTAGEHEFGLVIALGTTPSPRAQALAAAYHSLSQVYSITDPRRDAVHDDIADALRDGLTVDGVEKINVVVVAGTGLSASQNVLAVARIAAAIGTVSGAAGGVAAIPEIGAVILTEHAWCLPGDRREADLSHATLVGARRALYNEQSQVLWRLVDADATAPFADVVHEVLTWGAGGDEQVDEVCLRTGAQWVMRVRRNLSGHQDARNRPGRVRDRETSFALEVPDTRLLSDLAWREVDRVTPRHGQVEVRMDAVGLNYKDPLKVLGLLSAEELDGTNSAMAIGLEGMGTIIRVGAGVDDLAPGAQVLVSAPGMVQRYLTIDRLDCTEVPAHWSPGTCSSDIPFLTAEFGLLDAGRIRPRDTVLIHGAAGGVGLAAIQVARLRGARVIATASTDERRRYVLRAGAHEALDSRTVNFVDDVLRLTDGRGADVIFNTAPGEIVHQNFRAAAEFGRIVEIGKADIYRSSVIDLRPFDRNLSLLALDLDRVMNLRRGDIDARRREIVAKLDSGVYHHLEYRMYPMDEVTAAFDAVVRSTEIGRVVVDLDVEDPAARPMFANVAIRSDAMYLVTGGFGAFGLATARWLVDNGARHLTLVGRSGAASAQAKEQISAFREAGVSVRQESVDVTDCAAVSALVARAHHADVPLRGVYHAAGVVDDQAIAAITAESLNRVFTPKAEGAVHLDRAVHDAGIALDHFVLYSSMSGLIGGYTQVMYSAANSTLQAVAHNRRRRGEHALCVDWGAMGGGGMAEASDEAIRFLATLGFTPIDMEVGAEMLGECLRMDLTHVALMDIDWAEALRVTRAVAHSPRFSEHAAAAKAGSSGAEALRADILALPSDQRGEVVSYLLAEQLAVVMGVAVDAIDLEVPLPELGLDSLMAIEFGARVAKSLGVELAAMDIIGGHRLSGIGAKVAAKLENVREAEAA
jgi:acyl transferase domain-containing protein/NADPH:quinone reductase-like Zn-dependent oxidoreductase/NADP-dependent 3-hydroxy acid dehydrogenase YdfG